MVTSWTLKYINEAFKEGFNENYVSVLIKQNAMYLNVYILYIAFKNWTHTQCEKCGIDSIVP